MYFVQIYQHHKCEPRLILQFILLFFSIREATEFIQIACLLIYKLSRNQEFLEADSDFLFASKYDPSWHRVNFKWFYLYVSEYRFLKKF